MSTSDTAREPTSAPATKTLCVIGGSLAGALFIRQIAPKLPSDWHITLIEPSSHLVWYPGFARALVDREFTKRIFFNLADVLRPYKNVTHLQARAGYVNIRTKTIDIKDRPQVHYDYLVVASGASGNDTYRMNASEARPGDALHERLTVLQDAIEKADHIVIGGAGPAGVEMAAEIKGAYQTKKVVLINSNDAVVKQGPWSDRTSKKLQKLLKKIGVEVIHSAKVFSPARTIIGKTPVGLSNGTAIPTDVYIAAVGLKPNTSFLPATMLNEKGYVRVNPTLQSSYEPSIFALGDVTNFNRKFFLNLDAMTPILVKNMLALINAPEDVQTDLVKRETLFVPYTQDESMFVGMIHISRIGGAGQMGSLQLPSWLIKFARCKHMFLNFTEQLYVTGPRTVDTWPLPAETEVAPAAATVASS